MVKWFSFWFCLLCFCALFSQETTQKKQVFAYIGAWDRAKPLIESASRSQNIQSLFFDNAEFAKYDSQNPLAIIFVLNLTPEMDGLINKVLEYRKINPEIQIVSLAKRDSQNPLERKKLLTKDPKIEAYFRYNGLPNIKQMISYTKAHYLGANIEYLEPAAIPDVGYYHPKSQEVMDLVAIKKVANWSEDRPKVAFLIYQNFWITQDIKVIDAQIAALEKVGFDVATCFGDTTEKIYKMLDEIKPAIIVEDRHGGIWQGVDNKKSKLEELNVPYMRPISMLGYTIEEWLKDPKGLHQRDVNSFLNLQEFRGTIEPFVVGGLKESIMGFRLHEAVPERIERFAERAYHWYQMRAKKNAEKKLAIIYYNKSEGKDDIMRGSPTGAFLDAPESLVRFLPKLKENGYLVNALPKDGAELIGWAKKRARNIGPWAQGELEKIANQPDAILLPVEQYQQWFEQKLSAKNKQAVIEKFGPPPGDFMVVTRNQKKFFVVPAIQLGNIILAPQPERGAKQDEKLLHSRDVPPPHNYLAFYWWFQETFKADAVIHWGTHGSLELLPGKEAGMCADDWSDICIGKMLIINPWIMDNIAEATISRRRSYAALVNHLPPPAVNAGLTDDLQLIYDNINKLKGLEQGLLKEKFKVQITEGSKKARLDQMLKLELKDKKVFDDEQIEKVEEYLHDLYDTTTPVSMHIFGEPPPEKYMYSYLTSILRKKFLVKLNTLYPPPATDQTKGLNLVYLRNKAEAIVEAFIKKGIVPNEKIQEDLNFAKEMHEKLMLTTHETESLLNALNGGYIRPGPGPDPIRNPAVIPSGNNLYGLNPDEIPTKASWEVAKALVDDMLKEKIPNKIGFNLNGMETMRDFGVSEAQVFYLLGVKPVWDANGLVNDVELIPESELGHPRIDVFVALGGLYKENFTSRIKLVDKAIRIVAKLKEPDNKVYQQTVRQKNALIAQGYSENKAEVLSTARIFGTKVGNFGTQILDLVPRSGVWDTEDEILSVYVNNMSYMYTAEVWGEQMEDVYKTAIQETDTIIIPWASHMTSPLSNHHTYEYMGGLSLAVTKLTGKKPLALVADTREPDRARMRGLEEVLESNLKAELFNRKWIEGMKEHDYAGAGHMAELAKNLFGWSATREGVLDNGVWDELKETYVNDKYKVGMREWMEKVNPHALEVMIATMLEANRKKYWQTSPETILELQKLYAELAVKHGLPGDLVTGGNTKLEASIIAGLGNIDRNLVAQFKAEIDKTTGGKNTEPQVQGKVLESKEKPIEKKPIEEKPQPKVETKVNKPEQAESQNDKPLREIIPYLVLFFCLILLGIGILRKVGSPK